MFVLPHIFINAKLNIRVQDVFVNVVAHAFLILRRVFVPLDLPLLLRRVRFETVTDAIMNIPIST